MVKSKVKKVEKKKPSFVQKIMQAPKKEEPMPVNLNVIGDAGIIYEQKG